MLNDYQLLHDYHGEIIIPYCYAYLEQCMLLCILGTMYVISEFSLTFKVTRKIMKIDG